MDHCAVLLAYSAWRSKLHGSTPSRPAAGPAGRLHNSAEHAATPAHPPPCTLHTVDINSPRLSSFGGKSPRMFPIMTFWVYLCLSCFVYVTRRRRVGDPTGPAGGRLGAQYWKSCIKFCAQFLYPTGPDFICTMPSHSRHTDGYVERAQTK